jgi:WD40 repeat protein/serine/threonine protein kinase
MAEKNRCPQCGADLPANAPHGVCPQCLIKVGFEGNADATLEGSPLIEGPGTKIGHYELLELIGEGGMGLVYLAQQKEPVKRRVALKIVKLGMDTKQVVARFEAERQTLALLEHPNIAHVFDAGTTDSGRPYFVMEYVKGKSITKCCDEKKLGIEKRLELFQQVCEGVHHAHQKGIIHRDIKPSNILVSVQDDKPVPKIIDFGIAKAITQPLIEKTSYTEHGQLLGTPEYMSPEQAEMAYQDVDTRSDIYSLGVMLYELLAGATPFDAKRLREGGIDQIKRVICEEEPETPSARLTSLGDKAKTVAESRKTQIITLTRRLHRELEWIPMKAMRKDRTRRYRSASELADDIQNYLTGTPLIAGPESTVYRARKFMRRHAGSVATASLLLVVIILGLVASILMGCRAEQAREQEALARQKEVAARKQVEQALARAENAEKAAQEQAEEYRRLLYLHSISLADVAYHNNDIIQLQELLASCPEDLRGWEWHRLDYVSDEAVMTLRGQSSDIWGVAVSPDGGRIASGSADKTIKVWDATSGKELMTLRGHKAPVLDINYSPDGRRIVSGSHDKTVRVWDTATGDEVMILNGHEGPVKPVSFSPDGELIASGSADKTIKVWDATSGKELMTLRGHEGRVGDVVFDPTGDRIISAGWDKTLKLWDVATGTELMTLRGHDDKVSCVAISPNGKQIISGSDDRTLKLWDAANGNELMTLRGHTGGLWTVAFSVDGKAIASAGRDDVIRVWDVETGAELMTLRGHEGAVFSVAFDPDGKRIVSGSNDETVKVWNLAIDHDYLRIHTDDIVWQGVSFSPDGNRVLSGSREPGGLIRVWDRWTGTELMTLRGSEGDTVAQAEFSPGGDRIFSGQIRQGTIWDATTGEKLINLHADKGYVLATFSPDGKYMASWVADWSGEQHDYAIKLRDAETGKELMTLDGHGAEVQDVEFSPDSKRLVSGDIEGTIIKWSVETGAKIVSWQHVGGTLAIALSPDGARLATGGTAIDKAIEVWDTQMGKGVMTLRGHDAEIWSVAFSPNGKRIVSASKDRTVKIWDAASGAELLTIQEPRRKDGWVIPASRFSPDGKTIAIGGFGGIMLLESEAPAE